MKILIDTNIYRDFCDNKGEVVENFRLAKSITISIISLAELRAGFLAGRYGTENERVLSLFLMRPRISVIAPDEETTFHYARLFKQLRINGTPIPVNDLWIAALTIQFNLLLYSRDRHFDLLPQLPRI